MSLHDPDPGHTPAILGMVGLTIAIGEVVMESWCGNSRSDAKILAYKIGIETTNSIFRVLTYVADVYLK